MKKLQIFILCVGLSALMTSCDSFLDITPTGKVIAKTGEEYRAMLTYEYSTFPEDRGLMSLRSDEMELSPADTDPNDYDTYFDIWRWNDEAPSPTTTSPNWRRYWHVIYIANYLIEHQNEITEYSQAEVRQLVGESYMLRAYCHFLLANMFAQPYTKVNPETTRGVPVLLEADVNAIPRCSSLKAVYDQVLADIAEAQKYLNVEKWDEGKAYRFNVISAQALKARVCLYKGDWQGALTAAQEVIKQHGELQDLNASNGLLPDHYKSVESIVALEQVMTNSYKKAGKPSQQFIAVFKKGDQRKTKYLERKGSQTYLLLKGGSNEYRCSFRSAEAYLIAAEAAAQLNQLSDAKAYLTQLMSKRYKPSVIATYTAEVQEMNQQDLLTEIYLERFRELCFEGFRWDDLRRTTQPALTKTYKDETFELKEHDARYTLRFPAEAVAANPNLEAWTK